MTTNHLRTGFPAWGACLSALALAATCAFEAHATTGTMLVSVDTTLTEDHFGDIILTSDGIALDCAHFRVVGTGTGIGIDITGRTDVLVTHCFVENHGVGFRIQDTVNSEFMFNSATLNTSTTGGFFVNDSPFGVTLEANRSFLNAGRGFIVRDSTKVRLKSNSAISNGFRGFDVGDSTKVTLQQNLAMGNFSAGFVAFSSTQLAFHMNHSVDSGSEGYALLSIDSSRFFKNAAERNGTSGFRLSGGTGNDFMQNRALENGGAGFRIQASSNLLRKNSSHFNGPPADMVDTSCPGVLDTWVMNTFGTASCPGIN